MLALLALLPARTDLPVTVGGHRYIVRLEPAKAQPLELIENGRVLDRFLKREWLPWDIQIADADGDGRLDVAVGVKKRTRHLTYPHTSLWIVGIGNGHFTRKWLGSSMGRPLLEYCFAPAPKGTRQTVFTLERTLDGKVALSAFLWGGFGFRKVGGDKTWDHAYGLHQQSGRIVLIANGKQISLLPKEWK